MQSIFTPCLGIAEAKSVGGGNADFPEQISSVGNALCHMIRTVQICLNADVGKEECT